MTDEPFEFARQIAHSPHLALAFAPSGTDLHDRENGEG